MPGARQRNGEPKSARCWGMLGHEGRSGGGGAMAATALPPCRPLGRALSRRASAMPAIAIVSQALRPRASRTSATIALRTSSVVVTGARNASRAAFGPAGVMTSSSKP